MLEKFTFGIDHPLVTVRDHAQILTHYRNMGFALSPVSYHPWGTSTGLVMFANNFIELISMDDPSKIKTSDEFCFGRYIRDFLQHDEGVSLLALHSKDMDGDFGRLSSRLENQGRIDFRRKIVVNGLPDEAVVSLAMFLDKEYPRLSNFLCQQHRPELIWVPEWQQHPNGAKAIHDITYIGDVEAITRRWQAIYGSLVLKQDNCAVADTGAGTLTAMSRKQFSQMYPELVLPVTQAPVFAAMITVRVERLEDVRSFLHQNHIPYKQPGGVVVDADYAGNVLLKFIA